MQEQAKTERGLELARACMATHVDRYSKARLEIDRQTQIGVVYPKKVLTATFDGMDNSKEMQLNACFDTCSLFSIIFFSSFSQWKDLYL